MAQFKTFDWIPGPEDTLVNRRFIVKKQFIINTM